MPWELGCSTALGRAVCSAGSGGCAAGVLQWCHAGASSLPLSHRFEPDAPGLMLDAASARVLHHHLVSPPLLLQMRLRLTPEIRFVLDESIERAERVYSLLDQVRRAADTSLVCGVAGASGQRAERAERVFSLRAQVTQWLSRGWPCRCG